MAMNDATNLVSELLDKLSELEQKVEHHRQDMALEFQRYSRDLLQTVSSDVSAKVEKAIQDSMHKYPALHPAFDQDNPIRNESPKSRMDDEDGNMSSDPSHRKRGKGSPPPLLPHTSGTPPESENIPRSPHEREREFQGLFTPSYLPLLDSRDDKSHRVSPAPSLPTALPSLPSQIKQLTTDSAKDEQTAPLPVVITTRPDPVRRPTEDTISSNTSDESISKQHRRSALRRSSSSSIKIQSPRRVRFEVEGGEVFPTASPPLSPRVTEHTQSPLANATNLLNSSSDPEPVPAEEEETGLLGSSPPRPKKTSSTDRLKAMARNSGEDTSKWAMVGNLQDMDEDEEILVMGSRKPKSTSQASSTKAHVNHRSATPQSNSGTVEHVEVVKAAPEQTEPYEDIDEDILEMPPLTSFKTRKRFSPPQSDITEHSYEPSQNRHMTNKTAPKMAPKADEIPASVPRPTALDEDDELFDWDPDEAEDDGLSVQKRGSKKVAQQKYLQDEDDEEFQDEGVTKNSKSQEPEGPNQLSTSPGIPITHPAPASASTPSRHTKEAVGSYNGRPFTISSVKDHSILEKAAQMGNFYSFVGSVDGRSGVDESTSYRPDATTFTGTPKSLSQRLMMEEFEESRRQ
ncbi:hypothetical protein AB5N19_12877 [Seiridium cardinale]